MSPAKPQAKPKKKKYFRILSIDGGGIRGIIPAAVLSSVERHIQRVRGDAGKIGDYFDLVAGTSTGGILACLYLMPDEQDPKKARFSAEDGLKLYMENGDDIFDRSVWQKISSLGGVKDEKYSADALEETLRRFLKDKKLSDLIRPTLITAYALRQYRPFFFTQHDALKSGADDFLAWQVARATSAAPTYFEAAMPDNCDDIPNAQPMIDGGVFANNPTACALVESLSLMGQGSDIRDVVILSLGTGLSPKSISFSQCKDWGLVEWLRPIIGILQEGVSQTVDYQMKTVFDSLGIGGQYLRINGSFLDYAGKLAIEGLDAEMDHASVDNMRKLERFGRQLAQNMDDKIAKFADAYFA